LLESRSQRLTHEQDGMITAIRILNPGLAGIYDKDRNNFTGMPKRGDEGDDGFTGEAIMREGKRNALGIRLARHTSWP